MGSIEIEDTLATSWRSSQTVSMEPSACSFSKRTQLLIAFAAALGDGWGTTD